jgi:hypothetical protein
LTNILNQIIMKFPVEKSGRLLREEWICAKRKFELYVYSYILFANCFSNILKFAHARDLAEHQRYDSWREGSELAPCSSRNDDEFFFSSFQTNISSYRKQSARESSNSSPMIRRQFWILELITTEDPQVRSISTRDEQQRRLEQLTKAQHWFVLLFWLSCFRLYRRSWKRPHKSITFGSWNEAWCAEEVKEVNVGAL